MTILTCPMPANTNPLIPNSFVFSVHKLPEVTFFVQNVSLPDLNLGNANLATSVNDVPMPGDTLSFGNLSFDFMIDEDFKSYASVANWMLGLGYPENHQQFTSFINTQATELTEHYQTVSDATLSILDSSNAPIVTFTFIDCFPVSLSAIPLTTEATDAIPAKATVSMMFSHYQMRV